MKLTGSIPIGLSILLTAWFTIFCVFIFTHAAFSTPREFSTKLGSHLSSSKVPSSLGEKTKVRIKQAYGKLPLQFEKNEGKTDEQVKFLTRGSGYRMFFTPMESVLVLSKRPENGGPQPEDRGSLLPESSASHPIVQSTAIRMWLEGANPTPKMFGEDLLPGKTNYFKGSDPKKWRTNVSNFQKVRYQDVYPGIDLVYYGNQRQLEYDFIVQPGADPKAIRLTFAGIESYSIDNGGDLILHTALGDVIQKKPFIYQQIKGQRVNVEGKYIFLDKDRVAFHLSEYDHTHTLVIDPVLVYSTFLGGSYFDQGLGIAVDASGQAYVTGRTDDGAIDFPTTAGAFDETHNEDGDVFVSKLNAAGSALVYSTFLGGSGFDDGRGIAVDASGNAYVTGRTFDGAIAFPTTAGAFDETFNGFTDVFVSKLNAAGSALVYSTFLGGSGSDDGRGIAVDASGYAYVTGKTQDGVTDFPTTPGALEEIFNGGVLDGFVSKLNATGSALVYSTFLGGSGSDEGLGIAIDASGHAYVTGYTEGGTFPTTPGTFEETYNGDGDGFVSKLNAAGSALVYSTFLSGSGFDRGQDIAVDASGHAYVTGRTPDGAFPTTAGAFDEVYNGGSSDGYVSKLNAAGSALVYSTFLGGSGADEGWAIAVDASGQAYVTGVTFDGAIDFPTTAGAFDETFNGFTDAFVSKLNAAGSALVYSTFLGGSNFDVGLGIAVDALGQNYVTGRTDDGAIAFPTTAGAFDEIYNGDGDGFVSKFGSSTPQFENFGECISTLIADNCAGLIGKARATCNHEQQMTCFDLFGVQ